MATLLKAHNEWAKRPADERFVSLYDMAEHFDTIRSQSRATVVPARKLTVEPTNGNTGLAIVGPSGHGYEPTHWAFGQLATSVGAPAGYLRSLPAPLAADALNYGLQFSASDEMELGVLLQKNGSQVARAFTGPNYGRIWNSTVARGLVDRFGNGVDDTDWRVPGIFGKALDQVTKENTTLFASDRDMFVFLVDEQNRIEIPNRRDGRSGSLARGFFVWNSEVGASTLGIATFLFDYVCSNRMVWGATEYKELKMRHTSAAPERFLREVQPALESYAHSSAKGVTEAIAAARAARIDGKDGALDEFLANRFGKRIVSTLKAIHMNEESRPIETLWDATVAVTAYARGIEYQDDRVALERKAGELLTLASK